MSILPFVAIDGGPYRQRRLSGSPHWRPPPTRFLYSSKHAADAHNKPLIKACFWSRFEKTKVAIWSWICLCVYACVCERDRQRQRVYESERAAQVRKKTLLVLFSVTSPEYSALSLPPIDSQKLSIGWQLGWTGVEFSGTVNFPGTFFFFFLIWAMWFVSSGIPPSTEPIHLYIKRFTMRNQLILLWELAEQLQNL